MVYYKSKRPVDGRPPVWIIVDETGRIVNRNPSKEELKGLNIEVYKGNRHVKYTKKELLNYLIRFKEENGTDPICTDFDGNPKYPSIVPYIKQFGSWSNALELAGLSINKSRYTDEELLNYLRNFYREKGIAPMECDFENDKYPNYSTYNRRFGTWLKALKLVGLDIDIILKKGHIKTNQQKARFSEMIVRDHFENNPIDLAGENRGSHCDGICPNGRTYDVKSSGPKGKRCWLYYQFNIHNRYKEEIEIFYLLAFNEDYTILEHGWRVPGEIIESNTMYVGILPSSKGIFNGGEFNIDNMKKYDITDKLREVLKKYRIS